MTMNGMASHAGHGHAMSMAMGGVTFTGNGSGVNLLPDWLAVLWMFVFIAILVIHARHVAESQGQRRLWHSGHVLMAFGMAFMFAPGSIDHVGVPAGAWPVLFATAAVAILAWVLVEVTNGRTVNSLWIVMAIDMAAMAYMWSPAGYVAPLTWLLVAYFLTQTGLWATNRYRLIDERHLFGSLRVGRGGTIVASTAEPLVCERDLRLSMGVMTLGMAYMLAAMQLML